ncbi:MAG: hypothetical protein HQK77_06580 [Desulfobacterales bacterium]|nr:hypothetical protein [Desulfobacterales bacterium]
MFARFWESTICAILLGIIIDSISVCPKGLHVMTYVLCTVGTKLVIQYLDSDSYIILPFLLSIAVLFENLFFISTISLVEKKLYLSDSIANRISAQILWAVITGPPLVIVIKFLYGLWEGNILLLIEKRNKQ